MKNKQPEVKEIGEYKEERQMKKYAVTCKKCQALIRGNSITNVLYNFRMHETWKHPKDKK